MNTMPMIKHKDTKVYRQSEEQKIYNWLAEPELITPGLPFIKCTSSVGFGFLYNWPKNNITKNKANTKNPITKLDVW
jgi:hypothetical protein